MNRICSYSAQNYKHNPAASLIAISAIMLSTGISQPASAGDGPDWLSEGEQLPQGVTTSDTVMLKKDSTPFSLIIQAQRALKSGKPDLAIDIVRHSLELDNDDADAHMVYAEALERKLAKQEQEDPMLFNLCVKEWLSVLRSSYGEEKGLNFRGIGIPGAGGGWQEDEDRHRPARQHLLKLVGCTPKPWESNDKFLAKVRRSGETSVSGKIISKNKEQNGSQQNSPEKGYNKKLGNAQKSDSSF